MLKFKFNYLEQTLAYQPLGNELWYHLTDTFEGNFGSLGFQVKDGWITFSVYEKKIRAFYKQGTIREDDDFWEPAKITYFRKDLPRQCPVIFEFSERDQVEKVEGRWIKKGEPSM